MKRFIAFSLMALSSLAHAQVTPFQSAFGVSTNSMSGGVAACATDVASQVNAAVTAGYLTIIIPKNCIYHPTSNVTPANVTIRGEDARTSIISVTGTVASTPMYVGPYGKVENIGVRDQFCEVTADPTNTAKTCVIGHYANVSSTNAPLNVWMGQDFITRCGPDYTSPDSVPSTDTHPPCMSIINSAPTADGIFIASANTTGVGTSGIRIVTSGINDNGIYLENGLTTPSNLHYGLFVKDFDNASLGTAARAVWINRHGDATGVGRSLTIDDTGAASDLNTSDPFTISVSHQPSGLLMDLFQSTLPFSGTGLSMNFGSASGTFSGKFLNFVNNSVNQFNVDSAGNMTLAGNITLTAGGSMTGPFNWICGNQSAASWGALGICWTSANATLTDTTTNGTITNEAAFALPQTTLAFSSASTVTRNIELYIPSPGCGTNATCSNNFSLYTNGAIFNAGLLISALGAQISGATTQFNVNSNFNTSINTGTSTGTTTIGGGAAGNITNIGPFENAGGVTFTVATATGCSGTSGTPTTLSGGSQTGSFVSASSGTACLFVITINGATGTTAAHGWACFGTDISSAVNLAQSAKTTTTCTLRGTVNAISDTIVFTAIGY